MNTISIIYELVYRSKTHKHIQFTKDLRMCFDYKKCFQKKMYKGVWLDSKTFLPKSKFKKELELIPKYEYKEDYLLNFNNNLSKNNLI